METLIVALCAVVVIAVATAIAPRIRIAGPMILVAIGIGVGLLPGVDVPEVDPEWILVGVLPPLLYAAAVKLPAVEFRRDFGPIAGLAFVLVVVSSLVLGGFFFLTIPGIDPAIAIALGAILSPTDAVATAIARRAGISRRVVTMLEGESLLNDATALVLLRTLIAAAATGAAAASVSAEEATTTLGIGFLGAFVWGVIAAVVIGGFVGWANLHLRSRVSHPAANTALAFVVPFIAYLPTEALGGSGLVAAVVTGIVTGQGAARHFSPIQRRSDEATWGTVEVMLEGAVFLLMGLELKAIVDGNMSDERGLGLGLLLALGAFAILMVVRAGYVTFLVWLQGRRASSAQRKRLDALNAHLDDVMAHPERIAEKKSIDTERLQRRVESMRRRIARSLSDLDYYQATALGWKHGTVIVWAGMRGVVTLAAAQTLPRDLADRDLLIFIAFTVAVGSLAIQGLTLPWVVKMLKFPQSENDDAAARDEQDSLDDELRAAAEDALASPQLRRRDGTAFPDEVRSLVVKRLRPPENDESSLQRRDMLELRLVLIAAERRRLDDLSSGGAYSTEALRHALAELDADQLSLELRLEDAD
ncbi:sodium:proton antiporter [Microbacterium sp. C7(2022)]|uniref:cation:proton antiporter n=1 Tax=Microbacterium sp. C7(2022) TaxID=2992759 RepID=UPI00237AA7CB|nr:sodium:proton antiporter [Microbacterium sp. C7(2022)]MDE0545153.1 sodium:proton antiporter [Microbacterium sp. C7(2022)]